MVEFVNHLLDVPSIDPDDARRRKLLNILLAGVGAITSTMLLATATIDIIGLVKRDVAILLVYRGSLGALAGILIVFTINRYWSGGVASALFLLLLITVSAVSDQPQEIVDGRTLFAFAIPVLMASVLLQPWTSFAVAGLSSLLLAFIAVRAQLVPNVVGTLGLFAVALVSWLSARNLETALRELRAINRELDQRVEERTRELRTANKQLAEANRQLKELDRLKSRFVSMVSHELRTPLSAIQGFAEVLQAEIYGPVSDKQRKALRRIVANAKQLLHLVSDLLDQARIEAGQLSLHIEPFAPVDLVKEVRSIVGVLAESKGLELTMDIAADVPDTIWGDERRLRQILINLVNNAVKFTEEGEISVRIYRPDGSSPAHYALEVSDTGVGVPEEEQERIFAPFHRVDDSATRTHSGAGLGLSIVKQLVELLDGEIKLESQLGHGSTFTIILPLLRKEEPICE